MESIQMVVTELKYQQIVELKKILLRIADGYEEQYDENFEKLSWSEFRELGEEALKILRGES